MLPYIVLRINVHFSTIVFVCFNNQEILTSKYITILVLDYNIFYLHTNIIGLSSNITYQQEFTTLPILVLCQEEFWQRLIFYLTNQSKSSTCMLKLYYHTSNWNGSFIKKLSKKKHLQLIWNVRCSADRELGQRVVSNTRDRKLGHRRTKNWGLGRRNKTVQSRYVRWQFILLNVFWFHKYWTVFMKCLTCF